MNAKLPNTLGAWSAKKVDDYLQTSRTPLRLAVLDESGYPLICSLWFTYAEGKILCATTKNSKVVRCLQRDPKCGFELAPNEPPYFGIRGRGDATISAIGADDLLGELVERYLGTRDSKFANWLLNRSEDEVVVQVDIKWITSWDYSTRMSA